ncbi:hypothetical protein FHP25_29670 [Vineibacter terrae]|uniref:Uncharacterized protein n=1 Tax=Vineibacter terrae TaxID=2586908 RepID=A0A5C8PCT5_9HYPH|nr:Hsp70 family protein [Vineibacter terrae]TXL71547.1 hypothetical protein FHP25_29670 [Vineibacter terrae]
MGLVWIAVAAGAVLLLVVLLVLRSRRNERVIDLSGPSDTTGAEPARIGRNEAAPDTSKAESPGEILELRGLDDAECGLADWLLQQANQSLGIDVSGDRTAITRLADAAVAASADLKASGRARIDLPYIAADASGPKHFQREVTRAEAEIGMIDHELLLVDELLAWRGRDSRTAALGAWLETEAEEEGDGDGSLDALSTQRMADAAEQAMAEIARSGSASVDLPGLVRQGKPPFHFRRSFDRAALDEMIGEA